MVIKIKAFNRINPLDLIILNLHCIYSVLVFLSVYTVYKPYVQYTPKILPVKRFFYTIHNKCRKNVIFKSLQDVGMTLGREQRQYPLGKVLNFIFDCNLEYAVFTPGFKRFEQFNLQRRTQPALEILFDISG